MESPLVSPSLMGAMTGPSSRSRSSTKLDDVASLTSFNPFAEEDENDQSGYTLVTTLLSRMKNSLAPLSSVTSSGTSNIAAAPFHPSGAGSEARRASQSGAIPPPNLRTSSGDRPFSLSSVPSNPAPPLVSLTPVQSEAPTYNIEYDRSPSRTSLNGGTSYEWPENGSFGTTIPGFPIQDDARSIRTTGSINRSGSVSKVIRRIRGEGLSRDYWMDDINAKECYDCKSEFTTWRRKHHCRICGQIFCSRCASNVISGSRFGHDERIRVCNLCLDKLGKVDDDDDDDRRSVISSATSFPAHQLGSESVTHGLLPQSPFAASQLFGRSAEPYNLYSIAETRRQKSGSDSSGFQSRPITPQFREGEDGVWESIHEDHEQAAPFRRHLSEEKDAVDIPTSFNNDDSPTAPGSKTPVDLMIFFPRVNDSSTSSIQFPMGSPEHQTDSPRSLSRMRGRFDSYGDLDVPTPFIRSRVHSRLDSLAIGEAGWRTRRESTAYAQELNLSSMHHLKIMLRQMLSRENIPNIKLWEETLLKMALKISRDVTFTTLSHRQGEDMDVRRYVKIKKLPGGSPQDSEYVDGVVITKNVAHKQMSRFQRNARIMLVTFPLEFQRVEGQYMHFGQIFRQEKEYLNNLATRIAALRPHVVLVEKSVSRVALDALAKHSVAVARAVKPTVIQTIARLTQADIFSSMDKLALEPRLGHCSKYRLQSFDHPLIPGRRKTYMRFEGCSKDLGCTIIIRGETIDTLRRIKKVARFLTFVVRNLKLETHLWKDSVITLPALLAEAALVPSTESTITPSVSSAPAVVLTSEDGRDPSAELLSEGHDDLPDEDAERLRLSHRIRQSVEPYNTTFISISSTLRFPPPYPVRRMKQLDDQLLEAQRFWEDEVIRREETSQLSPEINQNFLKTPVPSGNAESTELMAINTDDIKAQIEALPVSSILLTPSPMLQQENNGYFSINVGGVSMPGSMVTSPIGVDAPSVKTVADISVESHLSLVKWQHAEQRRIWEWYLRKNKDDFVVEKYQCISLREFVIPMTEYGLDRACFPPQIKYITFYGENDCTLGQFIEKSVAETLVQFLDPRAICSGKGCDEPKARHCRVYVHNESRLFVAVEQWDGQIIGRSNHFPSPDLITTWSACRVCGSATPFIPVSDEMQRYSFAKFLELHFYPADVKIVQGAGCNHNIYKHHVRYFASKGMTVRFQADPIILYEVVYPPMRIRVRPESQLELKNSDYDRLRSRNNLWYSALIDDLKLISIDAATGDEEADNRLFSDVNALIARADEERETIERLINQIYRDTGPTDTLALNQVHAFRQDKIVAWQQDFDKLPKPKMHVDKAGKRVSAFGSVRMWPRRSELDPHIPSSSMSEAEEFSAPVRRLTGDSLTSSASEASEPETGMESDKEQPPISSPVLELSKPDPPFATLIAEERDPDSDSTIGASVDANVSEDVVLDTNAAQSKQDEDVFISQGPRASKLPRRSGVQPSVAQLVKKYQDYLPSQGVKDLAKTALSPSPRPHILPSIVSESEQEAHSPRLRRMSKQKARNHPIARGQSTSDFESGYTANIAPRYLATRRTLPNRSRIPALLGSQESQESSRRSSPEKRPSGGRSTSPHDTLPAPALSQKGKPKARVTQREKAAARAPERTSKSTYKRPPNTPGGKVSNMARHFERLGRDAERINRRYSVIRGKRARPVASARAKVEVLESIKDAIVDSEESSDSSSEADDEGEGDDDGPKLAVLNQKISPLVLPERSIDLPDITVESSTPTPGAPMAPTEDKAEPEAKQETVTVTEEHPGTEPDALLDPVSTHTPQPPPGPISLPPSPFISSLKPMQNMPVTPPPPDFESGQVAERNSILKAISGFWVNQPLLRGDDDPMDDPEHIFRDSSMIVRTDEPTSIIALALNSPQYRELLANSRAEKRTAREAKLTETGEAFMPDDRSIAESTSTWGVVNVDAGDLADPTEDLKMPSSKLPWAISFESGGLIISCTVLYAEQFDALRRTYDCEKSMIESLARCVKWNANGGKSGSAFLKTLDDRFIAKELSRSELLAMETFAPAYFDYMSSAVHANRPVLLAKVFGCYKLTFKKTKDRNPGKSKSTQMNLLVMENLFYDKRFSKIYDLKGSTRNRHVQSTGRENEVLLDENLNQTAHLHPFYLREHSKRILRGAIHNDTKFIEDVNVMDYSLVVGVDSNTNELVVGIVDYIRPYTWDKKLENLVKESNFLGASAKGEPTVVTPKLYRQRFLTAMERYFPLVPDRWMKQKDVPEEDQIEPCPDW